MLIAMKRISFLSKALAVLGALIFAITEAGAQCAMCKAVAQDAVDHQAFGVAVGLNSGIIYIMIIPYVLLGVLIYAFFRKRIKGFLQSFNKIHS